MRMIVDKPYSEDKWGYYGVLARRTKGKEMPLFFENSRGENAIITEGRLEDGTHFFTVKTYQHNNWIAVNTYYEDGTEEETYEK